MEIALLPLGYAIASPADVLEVCVPAPRAQDAARAAARCHMCRDRSRPRPHQLGRKAGAVLAAFIAVQHRPRSTFVVPWLQFRLQLPHRLVLNPCRRFTARPGHRRDGFRGIRRPLLLKSSSIH